MKKVVLLLACLSGCTYSNLSSNFNIDRMKLYENQATRDIKQHLQLHPNCDIVDIESNYEPMFIEDHRIGGRLIDGKVYININPKIKWTAKKFKIFKIHEDMHLAGKCLNDSIRSYDKPICYLFDEPIYYSYEINKSIEKHLAKDIK